MKPLMTKADSPQAAWARFRFSIIGPLLSCPPKKGELKIELETLSKKEWRHPTTGLPVFFSVSTLERWLYRAKPNSDPVSALRTKRRTDASRARTLSVELKQVLQSQYHAHPGWSAQLHRDNCAILVKETPALGVMPSYSTIRRFLKANNLRKHRRLTNRQTAGARLAAERLETREVRSYEVEYVHGLWHLDFHHGSRKILDKEGRWHQPLLLAVIDDHSRVICHAQWYLNETTESLVHGFRQALQKRDVPRALMSDNGSAMTSAEFTQGLINLGIVHELTLPYSPYQNAKQEVFWAQIEGRLMAMLEGEAELTLSLLNDATLAWIEFEYHHKLHSEIASTPIKRYVEHDSVGRPCPDSATLTRAFCAMVKRKQRRSDGTITLDGCRFEIPNAFRHLEFLQVRYASWDLRCAFLMDPHSETCVATLYPQDKTENANGMRRTLSPIDPSLNVEPTPTGIAPLLKSLMAEYAATGLPPAYLPQPEKTKQKSGEES